MDTKVRFASFLSGGFTNIAVINPPEKRISARNAQRCILPVTGKETGKTHLCAVFPRNFAKRPKLFPFITKKMMAYKRVVSIQTRKGFDSGLVINLFSTMHFHP